MLTYPILSGFGPEGFLTQIQGNMNASQNRAIHLLLNMLDMTPQKAALVEGITNGRTSSSTEMSDHEAAKLLHWLRNEEDRLMKPSRGKVMHLLGLMGYTDGLGKLDFERINAFVKGIGSNNPNQKDLFKLDRTELNRVVTQVEQIYKASIGSKKKAA